MHIRQASAAEILDHVALYLRCGLRARYRHFTTEVLNRRARNGVSHRQHSRSKITMINGQPHVRHQGAMRPVTCSVATLAGGKQVSFDLRLASEYLS